MKTILVTGANGFVGSHTLRYLENRNDVKVIAACRDQSKLAANYSGEVREGDLRDASYLEHLLEGVDVIINAMAWTCLWKHRKLSEDLFLQPTLRLIERYCHSNATRFINISTTSAASPDTSADAMSPGIPRHYWPHLCNVIHIENTIRDKASAHKTMVNMRLGIFAGEHYGLGILPILLPRLKTHLVPWVAGGNTGLPIVDGRDIGQALGLAATVPGLGGYEAFNIVGKEVPSVRQVIEYLHDRYGYPAPHFGVPFFAAYSFAWLMEKLDPVVPWEPLIVRSIVHLLEETGANNERARQQLGFDPQHDWKQSIDLQLAEMADRQQKPMTMARPT